MARDFNPQHIAFEGILQRGALVLLRSPAQKGGLSTPEVLRFQYNPESITRNRTGAWEPRKNQKDQKPTPADKNGQNGLRGGGLYAKAETIAMKLLFDATEMLLKEPLFTPKYGVLPELAVLEGIALAEAPKDDAAKKKDPKKGTQLTALAPKEVLLVLGARYFPVIVTSMNITEKRFSPDLVPLRAEVDLQMQILEATEVTGNKAITDAYAQLVGDRARNAALALGTDSSSAGNAPLKSEALEAVKKALGG